MHCLLLFYKTVFVYLLLSVVVGTHCVGYKIVPNVGYIPFIFNARRESPGLPCCCRGWLFAVLGSVHRCGFFFTDILLQCLLTSISLTGGDLKDKSTVRR